MGRCTKCGRECDQATLHYTGFGINARPRAYCPACWRKVQWAKSHANTPRLTTQQRIDAQKTRAEAAYEREERANRLYWERVDNYRELGYDPN